MNNYNLIEKLLLNCPLDILLKIRINPKNIGSPKITPNSFRLNVKYKIKNMIEDVLSFGISDNIDETRYFGGRTLNCFDLDHLDGHHVNSTNSRFFHYSSLDPLNNLGLALKSSEKGINIFYNMKPIHILTFIDVGLSTEFNMFSYFGANIIKTDQVVITFELGCDIFTTMSCETFISFKEYVDDSIVFIGSKTKMACDRGTQVRETFALIYNRNGKPTRKGSRFDYITLDPEISNIFTNNLATSVFTHFNQKILCVGNYKNNQQKPYTFIILKTVQ